jgi:hypothetical protein
VANAFNHDDNLNNKKEFELINHKISTLGGGGYTAQYGQFHSTIKQDLTTDWITIGNLSASGNVTNVGVGVSSPNITFGATGKYIVTYHGTIVQSTTSTYGGAIRAKYNGTEVVASYAKANKSGGEALAEISNSFYINVDNTSRTCNFEVVADNSAVDLDTSTLGSPSYAPVFNCTFLKIDN